MNLKNLTYKQNNILIIASLVTCGISIYSVFYFLFDKEIILMAFSCISAAIWLKIAERLKFNYDKKNKDLASAETGRHISGFSDMSQLQHDVNSQKFQGKFEGKDEENCFAKIINIFWFEIFHYTQRLRERNDIIGAAKYISLLFSCKEHEIRELILFQLNEKKICINDIDGDWEKETKIKNEIHFIVNNFEECKNNYFKVRYNRI